MFWLSLALTSIGGMAWDVARRTLDGKSQTASAVASLRNELEGQLQSLKSQLYDELRATQRSQEGSVVRLNTLWNAVQSTDAAALPAALEAQAKWNTTTDAILKKLHQELPAKFKEMEDRYLSVQKQISDKVVGVKHAHGYGK